MCVLTDEVAPVSPRESSCLRLIRCSGGFGIREPRDHRFASRLLVAQERCPVHLLEHARSSDG